MPTKISSTSLCVMFVGLLALTGCGSSSNYSPVSATPTATQYVYFANQQGQVLPYSLNPASGALTAVANPVTALPIAPGQNAVLGLNSLPNHAGLVAYGYTLSGSGSPDGIFIYSSDAQSGALKQLATTSVAPYGMAVSPDGSMVYSGVVGGQTPNELIGYSISGNSLTPLPGAPYVFPSLSDSSYLTVRNDGGYVYSDYSGDAYGTGFLRFTRTSTGALTYKDLVPTAGMVMGLAAEHDASILLVLDTASLSTYNVQGDATPTLIDSLSVNSGTLRLSADGTLAIVAGNTSGIAAFNISSAGAITSAGSASTTEASYNFAISPDNKFVVASEPNASVMVVYAIGSKGSLTQVSSIHVSSPVVGVAFP